MGYLLSIFYWTTYIWGFKKDRTLGNTLVLGFTRAGRKTSLGGKGLPWGGITFLNYLACGFSTNPKEFGGYSIRILLVDFTSNFVAIRSRTDMVILHICRFKE